MNADRIIRLLEAKPFKPFVVHFDGYEADVLVNDPTLARIEDDGETLIVESHRASSAERWTKLVDVRLIAVVSVQEGKNKPAK